MCNVREKAGYAATWLHNNLHCSYSRVRGLLAKEKKSYNCLHSWRGNRQKISLLKGRFGLGNCIFRLSTQISSLWISEFVGSPCRRNFWNFINQKTTFSHFISFILHWAQSNWTQGLASRVVAMPRRDFLIAHPCWPRCSFHSGEENAKLFETTKIMLKSMSPKIQHGRARIELKKLIFWWEQLW